MKCKVGKKEMMRTFKALRRDGRALSSNARAPLGEAWCSFLVRVKTRPGILPVATSDSRGSAGDPPRKESEWNLRRG